MDKGTQLSCLLLCALLPFASLAQKDPTAPLDWAQSKSQQKEKGVAKRRFPLPSLQSIICESGNLKCYAIINNELVKSSDSISGYRVRSITSESVTVSRGGKQWTLELFPQDIKQ
ncbi:MSHA biogenesis protein MshK [Vibrio sp. JC009]|uniref:MSHA biogenesis protein MshK n=1 Tax=Vibrio sp. JC009 TaxID=2912314 RepID=UPI0023AF338A|nr:MSHA biogenesis protein MshK [Vibrio sp. JC009]WED21549.1 MSHA biogenesis protein MshK [Vibrio sp. JC009]